MNGSLKPPIGGQFQTIPGIVEGICQRCLAVIDAKNVDGSGRRYCAECLSFGIIREDTPLFLSERRLIPKTHILTLPFSLSDKQKEASRFVLGCLQEKQSGFLHAVCGAGKTEILCESLLWAMNAGLRVCIAIPRKDIVAELAIRLQGVFPDSTVKPLHETAKDDGDADIVVSTVHQLIRYHREFDWIVLDEADAFPFRGDPFLHRLLAKALKTEGVLFQMSATVDPGIRRAARNGKMRIFTIPSRFHGEPLDRPEMISEPGLFSMVMKDKKLPQDLVAWLSFRAAESRQAILFVPSIRYGETLSGLVNQAGFPAGNVSSLCENAREIIAAFRRREWLFLVSTTILERGVTFKDIDCAILSADKELFDFDTLVQMAGRVGRDPLHPHGSIAFFAEDKTSAMERANRYIVKMNRQGRKEGLIHDAV
jgi:competence protein ComFA